MGECRNNSLCIYCYKPVSAQDGSHEGNYSFEFLQFFTRFLEIPLKIPVENQDFVSCDDCFELGEFFRKLYSQWEKLRLQLEWRVRELFEIIRAAGKVPSRVREFKNQYESNEYGDGDDSNKVYYDIQKLRKEILRGCKKKLKSSFPRVVLERIPNEDEIVKETPEPVDSFENFKIIKRMMTFIAVFQLCLPQSEASKGNPIYHNVEKYWKVQKQVQTCAHDDCHQDKDDLLPSTSNPQYNDDDDFHPGKDKDGLLPKTAISSVGAHAKSFEAGVSKVINMDINESVGKVSEIPVEIEEPSCNEARAQIQLHASTREALDCNPKPVKRRRGRPRLSEKSCVPKASKGSLEIHNSQVLDTTSKGKYELPSSATTPLLETNPEALEGDVEVSPKVIDVDVNDSDGEARVNLPETDAPAAKEVLISLRNLFKCPKCRRTFSSEARANAHIQQHERDSPSAGDVYEEQHMELTTKKDDSFSLEMINEASAFHAIKDVQVPEICIVSETPSSLIKPGFSECNQSFTLSQAAICQLGRRKLIKPYLCQWEGCPQKFARHEVLTLHYKKHSRAAPFQCRFCQISFFSSAYLSRHLRIHGVEGRFKCSFEGCHKSYTSKGALNNHEVTHTGRKPLICGWQGCARRFLTKCGLKKHHRLHTIKSSFWCLPCQLSFRNSLCLKVHLGTFHRFQADVDNPNQDLVSETEELGLNETPPTLPGQLQLSTQQQSVGVYNDPELSSTTQLQSWTEVDDSMYFMCAHCPFETGDQEELKTHLETHANQVGEEPIVENIVDPPIESCFEAHQDHTYCQVSGGRSRDENELTNDSPEEEIPI